MFSRILVLFPLVALAVANPLVARTEVAPLQKDLDGMAQTVTAMQTSCANFKSHVDLSHAAAVAAVAKTLDTQIKAATKDIPAHVVSDADGQAVCDSLESFLPELVATFESFIELKEDFNAVHVGPIVCSSVTTLAADNLQFINGLLAATPPSSKARAQTMATQINTEATKVKAAYC
ncbi:hypothetical protein EV421DRAFT_1808143 [Armillaria borealis]|uniref:Hydrophobic surface binding protein n=1 Tax=Armillaria borealis TaxID=47425 RepID=A0AA39MPT2_9AGAR|nr:hypothetical protein EV421DRAFT_2040369 [Armillaria borealis]KAK0442636.1 hypothetical protein EV421DRAFT_1808143 [Armillaria borealis]